MERPLALVVDGDPGSRQTVASSLSAAGIEGIEAASGAEALEILRTRPVRILVVDPGTPGAPADFLERALRARPSVVPVALTSSTSTDALRQGAFDVVAKPVDPEALRLALSRALAHQGVVEEVGALREQLRDRTGYRRLVGRSDVMERVRDRVERQAGLDAPVLLLGEPGSGKKLVARTIHEMSSRREGPFVRLDGSAPAHVLSGELLGLGRGALPGGDRRSRGVLENAERGSCLLDDVTSLPPELQERLVETMEHGSYRRVGGSETLELDVRWFASSDRDLDAAVRDGRFRADLRQRLGVGLIQLPPLRERRGDVALLARYFIETICEINDLPPVHLSPEALELLEAYAWPGNVRELQSAMEHAVIVSGDHVILPRNLPRPVQSGTTAPSTDDEPLSDRPFREAKRDVVDAFEKRYLSGLLEQHRGNVTAAAQQAGMLRSALQRLLRKHELRSVDFRGSRRVPARSRAT